MRTALLTLVVGVAGLLPLVAAPPAALAADDPCGPNGNKISCENSKPGTPASDWDTFGAGDEDIQGFATDISVNVGGTIGFKVDTDARAYSIDIFRIGYYGGMGARKIDSVTPSATLPQTQDPCITEAVTELYDCGNWKLSASWNVPSTAVSGVYIARLKRPDNGHDSHITFVVRDDSSHSDVVFQTSDPTWQAYNEYGGSSFYHGGNNGRAYKLSYNRPFQTRDVSSGRDFFFANEYPLVRFMERNGYDMSYLAGVDTDRRGALLKNHKVFLSVGHDEYWSGAQRANVEAARDAGVNLMFLSGNEVYWRTRYENSADTSHTPYRTLVSYKETWGNAKIDPAAEWTGTWRDPRFAPRSQGAGTPENSLTGTMYQVNNDDLAVTVSPTEGKNRLWRHTALGSISSTATLAPHTIGYESDEDIDNGHRPDGLVRLTRTTGPTPEYLVDYGNTVEAGTTTHSLTLYRAASGALVFGAGTVQWTWGLDDTHDSAYADEPADPRMQQAQVNLLADMSAQPTTIMSTLTKATKSTDTAGPTVTIQAPAAGATTANGANVTVSGTAADAGGGVVAGVEVSTDGGSTWHAATGTTSWSYSYIQKGTGATPVKVRAMDDSANIGTAATRSLDVKCPCSIFGQTVPKTPTTTDAGAVELGLRFEPKTDGFVSGVRFYKGAGNTGTHVGSLWDSNGQRLASVTFSGETGSGWQTASFGTPVPVDAGKTYVVSYTAPNGHYPIQSYAFTDDPLEAPPLRVAGGFGAAPAGVYGNAGTLPTQSFRNTNYFVDVSFTTVDESPLTLLERTPAPDAGSIPATTKVTARYSKPVSAASAKITLTDSNGAQVPGSSTYDATTRTVTFTPSANLAGFVRYTAAAQGTDAQGNNVTGAGSWSFTTARPPSTPGVCPCTLFDDGTLPATADTGETRPVTLGVKFSSTRPGVVTGLRFYKAPGNTGTHVGVLWTAGGAELARGTFTNETSSGWQTLTFADPVRITKNTDYVVSYRSTTGSYPVTPNAFALNDLSRTPLKVTSQAGAYTYADAFPSASTPTNYLVDPVFEDRPDPIAITAQDPAPGAVDIGRKSTVRVWFSGPITSAASLTVKNGSTTIAGTKALSGDATMLTFTPTSPLPAGATLTVNLSGVVSTDGATLPASSWQFGTSSADDTTQTLFTGQLPTVDAVNESSAVELGTRFVPAEDGTVSGVRFFKGAGNGGTHTGSLWSATGTRLATVTFTGETPTGWQTAKFSSPVAVTAGTTYVVSYLAPQGHYASTARFFDTALVSGDLTAPAGPNNGVYVYGGGFPSFSYQATNYFVDVVYTAGQPVMTVTDKSPAAGTTDVDTTTPASISFSAALANGYSVSATAGGNAVPGQTTKSADGKTLTFTPTNPWPADADVSVTASGLVSTRGATLPTQTWTFRTRAATTVSLFTGLTPSVAAVNDTASVELGTKFVPAVSGKVTGVRFYKGTGNGGTHTGTLWSATGTSLGTVTFTGETSTGWQTAKFATPVAVTAGTTYVVSYLAPQGRYSSTGNFFAGAWVADDLTAPAGPSNGVYRYGGGFPANSWGSTNYFVDVLFQRNP